MGRLFKNRDEARFAAVVSRMVYCNPFTPERLQLEVEALGSDFDEAGRDWNLDPWNERRHHNMALLYRRMRPVLDSLVEGYRAGAGTPEERAHYADLVTLLLYIKSREALDDLIERSHGQGMPGGKVRFYGEFFAGFEHYFGTENLPVQPEHLFACYFQIRRAFFHIFHFFVGTSDAATNLRARIWQSIFTHDLHRYQRSLYQRIPTIPTLITGPSGSGKEVVAQAIGYSQYIPFNGREAAFQADFTRQFFPVNLSALSPTLIESELFGHRKGAFTGALADREGYFSACGAGGTVFLDEIGELDHGIQVKLLRVLQTRHFQRLGDVESEAFQGKIITATNRDLQTEIKDGCFREDFYFRLRSDTIETRPLLEMTGGDASELQFLAQYAAGKVAGAEEATDLAKDFSEWARANPGYGWPGNFRELEQALRSLLVHGTYLPPGSEVPDEDGLADRLAETGWTLQELSTAYIRALYRRNPVYEELARRLKVDRRTVKRYLNHSE